MPGPRVLYVVYWGAAEPLGRSLVLPAVSRLASLGVELSLVTFEKPADLAQRDEMQALRRRLDADGVRWLPLRYHKRPKWPATAFDVAHGVARCAAGGLRRPPQIVHARTFVGGHIGLAAARLLGARLVYHNEGFYPDEQVDSGVWTRGSPAHRLALALERRLYARADGIVAISERGRALIEGWSAARGRRPPTIAVPSCVDLRLFPWMGTRGPRPAGSLRLAYVGSVGGRYRLDSVGAFAAAAARRVAGTRLRVLTPAPAETVDPVLAGSGLEPGRWSVACVPHERIPEELAGQDAGLLPLTRGLSEHGGSPTKIGEYWAAGLPVVITANVGDVEDIIRRERVGVVLGDPSPDAYDRGVQELLGLLDDPGLAQRCRRAAETHYALEPACRRQLALYQELAGRG